MVRRARVTYSTGRATLEGDHSHRPERVKPQRVLGYGNHAHGFCLMESGDHNEKLRGSAGLVFYSKRVATTTSLVSFRSVNSHHQSVGPDCAALPAVHGAANRRPFTDVADRPRKRHSLSTRRVSTNRNSSLRVSPHSSKGGRRQIIGQCRHPAHPGSGRSAMTGAIDLGFVRRPIALIRSSPEQITAYCGREGKCLHETVSSRHGLLVANRALKSVGSNPPPGAFRAFSGRWKKTSHNFSIQSLISLAPSACWNWHELCDQLFRAPNGSTLFHRI
jgi:hypothetical protein